MVGKLLNRYNNIHSSRYSMVARLAPCGRLHLNHHKYQSNHLLLDNTQKMAVVFSSM